MRVCARLTPRESGSRVRQIIHFESGADIHATRTLTAFRKPVPVRPPVTP